VIAGLALLQLANRFYVGSNVPFDFSGSDWYWKMLANMARDTRVEGWYQVFRVEHPFRVEGLMLGLVDIWTCADFTRRSAANVGTFAFYKWKLPRNLSSTFRE
jgi:hypothetical protein